MYNSSADIPANTISEGARRGLRKVFRSVTGQNWNQKRRKCFYEMEETMESLLTLADVCEVCRVGYSILYRWRRSGAFPEPVGEGKLLWTHQQIIEWMGRRSAPAQSTITTASQKRKEGKAFDERQATATKSLQRHANNR